MKEVYPSLATETTCVGCMACVDICQHNAISQVKGDDGHWYVVVDTETCVGCKLCENVCKRIHAGTYSSNEKISKPYAICSTDLSVYNRATSGGVFGMLAKWILCQGGIVYGAAYTDGIHIKHKRIESIAELFLLQGSKYLESNMNGIFKSIATDLKDGKIVLFSGVGCQVAAVLAYFGNNKYAANLYTCDIICGGVPSSLLIESYAKNTPGFSKVHHFRNKEKYEFAYLQQDGDIVLHKKALPISGFESLLTNRYSCYNCLFTGLHRKSDWTIGDYWGDSLAFKTRSVCVCHNERANQILNNLDSISKEAIGWDFIISNPRIVNGKVSFENRLERRYLGYIFNHFSYNTICKIYGSEVNRTDVFWYIYKVYKYLRFICHFNVRKKEVKKILKDED